MTAVLHVRSDLEGSCRCPSCGTCGEPVQIVRCAERITFYVCPADCGFSTWDRPEFVW